MASEGRTMGENIRPLESLGPSRRQSAARRARRSRAYSCRCDDYHSWTQKVLHQKSQIVREALLMHVLAYICVFKATGYTHNSCTS